MVRNSTLPSKLLLGVWAEEEDDYRPSFGKRSSKPQGAVRFISGGVAVGNKHQEVCLYLST